MSREESICIQKEIVEDGKIVGTPVCIREIVKGIIKDGRPHVIISEYGESKTHKPGKEPGTQYSATIMDGAPELVTCTNKPDVNVRNIKKNLTNVFCVDSDRQGEWRSIRIDLIRSIQVFTGKKDASGRAESVCVPVEVVTRTPKSS